MTSREIDPAILEAVAVLFGTITGSVIAAYHWIFRRGQDKANNDNHDKLKDKQILDLEQELANFKKWATEEHEKMNQKVEEKIDKLVDEMKDLGEKVSENSGYLKALLDKTP